LEGLAVPFPGSGSLASAMSMNKHATKSFLKDSDIKMPHHELIKKENFNNSSVSETFRSVPMPAVVKPADNGSSFGISIVRTPNELAKGLEKAFSFSDLVIVEEYLPGREATCGVIDGFRGEEFYTLPPIEIIHDSNFFDYDAKYSGKTKEIVPSNFSQSVKDKIREYSKKVHQVLNLKHYSRSDFIVHPKRGVYFLEVNTLPGLTSESLFPKSLNAVGATTAQFLDHIILISLNS
jgi:D-alanine-D-alanine ligase